jgi:hypothetical protein
MTYAGALHFNNVILPIFETPEGLWLESTTLSLALGYRKTDSLRQQVLRKSRWFNDFTAGKDYFILHYPVLLREWEAATGLKPTPPARGVLFLSYSGIRQICSRTSHRSLGADLHELLKTQPPFVREYQKFQMGGETPWWHHISSAPSQGGRVKNSGEKPSTLEERRFQYEVLHQLLTQLQELKDPLLCEVAIRLAEDTLGQPLPIFREALSLKSSTAPRQEDVPETPKPSAFGAWGGPVFEKSGWYTCREIGEKAGGYTRVQAGRAADLVAARAGFSHEQLRQKELPFNKLELKQVGKMKKPQLLFSFNREFSNKVIYELRTNSEFLPPSMSPERPIEVRNLIEGPFEGESPRLSDWGSEM